MRAPITKQPEEFPIAFPPQKIAVVKVKCLLQAAINTVDKLPPNIALPYSASLNLISSLFDDDFSKKAYQEICNFDYRLRHEDHPCGKKTEDFVREMVKTIYDSNLLAESDS